MKTKWIRLAALLLAAVLLTGCTPARQEPEEEQTETEEVQQSMASDQVMEDVEQLEVLRLAYQPTFGLDPYETVSLCNRTILSLIYEPLFQITGSFQAQPVLAQSIEVSADGQTAVITLRPGVRFHDGSSLTAQDVAASYEKAKSGSYYGGRFDHILSVRAQEDGTVAVNADTSMESVELLLDFPITKQSEEGLQEGTGPFRKTGAAQLEPFEQWWGEQAPLGVKWVELTACNTTADIRDQFEYGNVNLVCTDPNSSASAAYHSDSELWSCPTTVMQYIGFNQNTDVFKSNAIRSCVTYAIDREAIVMEEMGGFALPATLPASPLAPCYNAGLADDYAYHPATFRDILDEAQVLDYTGDGIRDIYVDGYPESVGGTMIVNAVSTQRVLTANRIAEDLNKLGFDITVKALDEGEFRYALSSGQYDLYYAEVRLAPNFDLSSFFRTYGSASYGGMADSLTLTLCGNMLENSGNAYDLHKQIMGKGYLCPVLFKTYAVYTTRGAAGNLEPGPEQVFLQKQEEAPDKN